MWLEQSSVCVVDGEGRIVREDKLASEPEMLETVIGAMLVGRAGLQAEFMRLHKRMLALVRNALCRDRR